MLVPSLWIAAARRKKGLRSTLALLVIMVFGCSTENSFIFHPSRPIVATPADVGLPYEDVTLTTKDGTQINGWLVPAPGAKSTLLWFHGNAGNISHRVDNIRKLYDRVLAHIFIIDYRGYGRSQGVVSEDGTYQDADAALAYLHSREDIDANHIVVFGRSLGAAVGLDLAARQDTRGLILESPFVSVKAMAKTILPLPIGPFLRTRYDNLAKIRNLHTPLLILHGDRDSIVPFEQGKSLFAAAPEPKSFYTIAGAGHNDTYLVGGNDYFKAIANFIQQSNKMRRER